MNEKHLADTPPSTPETLELLKVMQTTSKGKCSLKTRLDICKSYRKCHNDCNMIHCLYIQPFVWDCSGGNCIAFFRRSVEFVWYSGGTSVDISDAFSTQVSWLSRCTSPCQLFLSALLSSTLSFSIDVR